MLPFRNVAARIQSGRCQLLCRRIVRGSVCQLSCRGADVPVDRVSRRATKKGARFFSIIAGLTQFRRPPGGFLLYESYQCRHDTIRRHQALRFLRGLVSRDEDHQRQGAEWQDRAMRQVVRGPRCPVKGHAREFKSLESQKKSSIDLVTRHDRAPPRKPLRHSCKAAISPAAGPAISPHNTSAPVLPCPTPCLVFRALERPGR